MFTSKGLFSNIQCPYQETCVLPRCIFAHSKGLIDAPSPSTQNEVPAQVDDQKPQAEPGRKRQKLDSESHTVEREISKPAPAKLKTNAELNERSSKPHTSLNREVSPPPLRKKPSQSLAGSNSTVSKPTNNVSRAPSTSTVQIPSKPAEEKKTFVKAPPKKEALNPRALGIPSPATHEIRFRLVRALHEQLKRLNSELEKEANDTEEKLVLSEQALITMALDLEQGACGQPSIYSNVVKNKIMLYKRMSVGQWKEERAKEVAEELAEQQAREKPKSNLPVFQPGEPPKPIVNGLTPKEELAFLPRLCTPVEDLSLHGYVSTIPTPKEIESAKSGMEASKGWEICDRCKTRFQVFPDRREEDGVFASGGHCTYHYGKPFWEDRNPNDPTAKRQKKFRCCKQVLGESPGCTKADSHVFKITEVKRLAAVLNFEETPENPGKEESNPVCIDGEMGYTVYGLELIRLTATSWPSGDAIFDVLVKPQGGILDLNSRYSGVYPKDLANALPYTPSPSSPTDSTAQPEALQIVSSPSAARALLFSHLSPSTPLIGHGLENDLNATRIVHPTIIDTVLLFPHKAGLPYRNRLKDLMAQHLNRQIQVVVDGKALGHDSKEDANAAGMLVRYKIGEEWRRLQRAGWVWKDGRLVGEGDARGKRKREEEEGSE
ncbi:hypothetical protein HYALB_00012131 [Hymenoscyphus albidus]|uniref:Exonuclease domain-containing protein n=1 Tax=Hymenoscyphus albidus TaxID=595503 RepID=A0A9N9LJY8_9HELO|nr:hypothetical protein HYALB_00012131 [Hymenoscyphus albidus]